MLQLYKASSKVSRRSTFWNREYFPSFLIETLLALIHPNIFCKDIYFTTNKSYYLEEHDNKQIKFSNKIDSLLEEKYAFIRRKNITNADALNETYRFTATLYVKISPVFEKVIVTKIKI